MRPLPTDKLFVIRYRDGLEAYVGMFDSVGECFAFSCRRRGADHPDATVFDLQNGRPFGHFGYLVRAIEHLIVTGRPPYPVERTLLTSGILSALFQSHAEGGTTDPSPPTWVPGDQLPTRRLAPRAGASGDASIRVGVR